MSLPVRTDKPPGLLQTRVPISGHGSRANPKTPLENQLSLFIRLRPFRSPDGRSPRQSAGAGLPYQSQVRPITGAPDNIQEMTVQIAAGSWRTFLRRRLRQ